MNSRFVSVDGVRTHYLEAGEGPTLVLLHGGEFGGCAELSWEYNIPALAEHFRVVAPDLLGYGETDKLRDFGGQGARILSHITRFLQVMAIDEADFIGNSLSGRFLCRIASAPQPVWPIRRMISVSGGGFEPDNAERRVLQNYDCTPESMRAILRILFHDPHWSQDEGYVARRHRLSLVPGAWEVAAASRFKSPVVPERPLFGRPDRTEYERISVPTLFCGGDKDPLLVEKFWLEVSRRTPGSEYAVFENCGHCPNIEQSAKFNEVALKFLLAGRDDGVDPKQ
jgi:pimeloyl-ACP methyl ester carboxylesterase